MIILPEADAKGMLMRIEDLEARQGNQSTFFSTLNIVCGKCKITRGGYAANIGDQASALDGSWHFADDYSGQLVFKDFTNTHDGTVTVGAFTNDAYLYDSIWGRFVAVGTTSGDHQQATLSLTAGYQGETGYALHPGISEPTDNYRFSGIEIHAAAATGWVALDSIKHIYAYTRNDGHIFLLPNYIGNITDDDDLGQVVVSRSLRSGYNSTWTLEVNSNDVALHAGLYTHSAQDLKWHMKHTDIHWSLFVDGTADTFAIRDETAGAARLTIDTSGSVSLGNLTSTTQIEIDVASGDPIIIFDTQGADKFTIGVDDSESDSFMICTGGSLGQSTAAMTIDSSRHIGLGVAPSSTALLLTKYTITATSGILTAFYPWAETNPSGASSTTSIASYAVSNVKLGNSQNITGSIVAFRGAANHYGTGTVTAAYGSWPSVVNRVGGTITAAYGLRSYTQNVDAGGTITNGYGLFIDVVRSAGTITTAYGVYINNVQGTTEWGIYQVDASNNNYLAGALRIGTTAAVSKCTVNGALAIVDGMTAPGATAGWTKFYVDTADGDLKVVFGDGTVKTIVTDT